jgi:hypothetical protein
MLQKTPHDPIGLQGTPSSEVRREGTQMLKEICDRVITNLGPDFNLEDLNLRDDVNDEDRKTLQKPRTRAELKDLNMSQLKILLKARGLGASVDDKRKVTDTLIYAASRENSNLDPRQFYIKPSSWAYPLALLDKFSDLYFFSLCSIMNLFIVFFSGKPLDMVLNSLAFEFVSQFDNELKTFFLKRYFDEVFEGLCETEHDMARVRPSWHGWLWPRWIRQVIEALAHILAFCARVLSILLPFFCLFAAGWGVHCKVCVCVRARARARALSVYVQTRTHTRARTHTHVHIHTHSLRAVSIEG